VLCIAVPVHLSITFFLLTATYNGTLLSRLRRFCRSLTYQSLRTLIHQPIHPYIHFSTVVVGQDGLSSDLYWQPKGGVVTVATTYVAEILFCKITVPGRPADKNMRKQCRKGTDHGPCFFRRGTALKCAPRKGASATMGAVFIFLGLLKNGTKSHWINVKPKLTINWQYIILHYK
jgi:hypothetical protein